MRGYFEMHKYEQYDRLTILPSGHHGMWLINITHVKNVNVYYWKNRMHVGGNKNRYKWINKNSLISLWRSTETLSLMLFSGIHTFTEWAKMHLWWKIRKNTLASGRIQLLECFHDSDCTHTHTHTHTSFIFIQ